MSTEPEQALETVKDAAGSWADELVTYIAKGSEEYGDEESAAAQRQQAAEIRAAIALLTGCCITR